MSNSEAIAPEQMVRRAARSVPGASVLIAASRTIQPRCLDRAAAAEVCRCTEDQFQAMVDDFLFPGQMRGMDVWDRKALMTSLHHIDIRSNCGALAEVYFIQTGKFIKIGFSHGVYLRLGNLQNATPYPLELLSTINGDEREERRIHALFPHLHHRGEWYRRSKGLIAYIDWLKRRDASG